ncbi:MAG: cobalamin biosynthesis protein CbiD [Clostridiaceae bacterium]|nr:cobalamin biosynthesis protein CbiD [Clostridiaceae bacterium]
MPMEEYIVKDGKKLRLGYTTGSCAAAASKAAAWMLLTGRKKERIQIHTPKGIELNLAVLQISRGENAVSCAIKKDSGDDPDITKDSLVFAHVSRTDTAGITIEGGQGIGRVTKRGLDQPVGAAAINSVPRQMIRENLEEVCRLTDYHGGLSVVISVPDGERLAKKTFNPRLGIVGGISILGTTGIVEPMSEQALVDTIRIELRQRKASGAEYVLLTPGNYGLDYIKEGIGINPELAIPISNFIGDALDLCKELGFRGALLVGHIGKLVKVAGGILNTHSKFGDCRMEIMAAHAGAAGLRSAQIQEMLECVTCDDALRVLTENGLCQETLKRISDRISYILDHRVDGEIKTAAIMFSKQYGFLSETENARSLLKLISEE